MQCSPQINIDIADTLPTGSNGASGFTDVTTEAGVGDMGLGTTGSWGDFGDDGDLDLYVANWDCNFCPNTRRDGLYRNEGDGTFADISDALGPEAYGIGFVHKIPKPGVELYVSYKHYELDEPGISNEDLDIGLMGARVKF